VDETGKRAFVGIDWGVEAHRVCVLDGERKVLDEFNVEHDGAALGVMVERVLNGRAPSDVVVGIESRWNAAAETLLERGVHVFTINPKQVDRFRDRHTVAGAKDDRRDAFVIADALRTDAPAFREVTLGDPRIVELRELSRIHDELKDLSHMIGNRLFQQVVRIFPQLLELGSLYKDGWLLELLEQAPTPAEAQALKLSKVRAILNKHRIRRLGPEAVQTALRKTALTVAPGVTEAARAHIRLLLPQLRLVQKQLDETAAALESILEALEQPSSDKKEHRDVTIIRSLPGVGVIVAATMLAEARDALAERDYHRLRLLGGLAPVTKQSGKSSSVTMRYACNQRLRTALFFMANTLVLHDRRSKALYASHRARGHSHGHTLRVVADRALKLLVGMLRSDTTYDPIKRVA
jgi:transposase